MSSRLFSSCLLRTLSRIAVIFAFVTSAHVGLLAQSVRINSSSAMDFNIPAQELPTRWPAGTRIGITDNGHRIGLVAGTGEIIGRFGNTEMKGTATAYPTGEMVYSTSAIELPVLSVVGGTAWPAGSMLGVRDNGHSIGPVGGTAEISVYFANKETKGTATAYPTGEIVCSGIDPETSTKSLGSWVTGVVAWPAGTVFGLRDNGHTIGPVTGTGRIEIPESGSHLSGTATAYPTGEIVYSANGSGNATKEPYWDGHTVWTTGAVLGVIDKGRGLGVVSGTGKVDYHDSGGHVTGTATATDGEIVYTVASAATTSEYWDGHTLWAAGAVLGAIDKGHRLGVVSGKGKVDYHDSGAHVTGAASALNGETIYTVTSAATTSPYWDGHTVWAAGAMLGAIDKGHRFGVVSGSGNVDYHKAGAHITGTATAANGKTVYHTRPD